MVTFTDKKVIIIERTKKRDLGAILLIQIVVPLAFIYLFYFTAIITLNMINRFHQQNFVTCKQVLFYVYTTRFRVRTLCEQ